MFRRSMSSSRTTSRWTSGDCFTMRIPFWSRQAVFAGQPVALVVAESEATAQDGVDAVVVEYTPIQPTVDMEAAMAVDAALARPHKHNPAEEDRKSTRLNSSH